MRAYLLRVEFSLDGVSSESEVFPWVSNFDSHKKWRPFGPCLCRGVRGVSHFFPWGVLNTHNTPLRYGPDWTRLPVACQWKFPSSPKSLAPIQTRVLTFTKTSEDLIARYRFSSVAGLSMMASLCPR
uniref:(northern house mosquito) hypothetical protein n=1 Tax=Culex pipiens TaxID=7175 RepID=A0A8D8GWU1_CULPI